MRLDADVKFWLVVAAIFVALFIWFLSWVSRYGEEARKECEAAGGVLIQERGRLTCIAKSAVIKLKGEEK